MHPENIASQRVLEKAGLTFINEADYFGMHVRRYVTTADRHGAYTISTDPGKLDVDCCMMVENRGLEPVQCR